MQRIKMIKKIFVEFFQLKFILINFLRLKLTKFLRSEIKFSLSFPVKIFFY